MRIRRAAGHLPQHIRQNAAVAVIFDLLRSVHAHVNREPRLLAVVAFRAHGGKLLLYHGWSDGGSAGAISPLNTINYYDSILAKMGASPQDWLRLFMVPGMAHCGGGPGPNQVNWMAALNRWRESGIAPDRVLASRVNESQANVTRPLCAYPAVAKYTGSGSTNDAANFVCTTP